MVSIPRRLGLPITGRKIAFWLGLAAVGYPVATGFFDARSQGTNGGAAAAQTTKKEKVSRNIALADVAQVSQLLRLEPCDRILTPLKLTLDGASAAVGNPAVGCTIWARPETPEIVIFASAVEIDGARLPVVVYFNSRYIRGGTPDSFVIDVVGGPGGDISPGLNDNIPLALVRSGVIVAKLGYTGTRHGTIFPHPNFDLATRQVLGFTRAVRAENPASKLVLLGESLGGPIVAHAAASKNRLLIDGLALVLPLLFTPDEAMNNFALIRNPRQSGGMSDLTVRTIDSARAPWGSGQVVKIPGDDLFERFFPPGLRGQDLGEYLGRTESVKTLIAFGDSDKVVGLSKLDDASLNTPNIRKLRLRGVPHLMNAHSASQVSDEILDYLL